jgi:MULE transposase domain
VWALRQIKNLNPSEGAPSVVITEKEHALVQALQQELPLASHLLCRFHVLANVTAHALMDAPSVPQYESRLAKLYEEFKNVPDTLQFIMQAIERFAPKLVRAYTIGAITMGGRTASRAEGMHNTFKLHARTLFGRLKVLAMRLDRFFASCINDIKHRISAAVSSRSSVGESHPQLSIYRAQGDYLLSTFALGVLESEVTASNGIDANAICDCHRAKSLGLPCWHMIARDNNTVMEKKENRTDIYSLL